MTKTLLLVMFLLLNGIHRPQPMNEINHQPKEGQRTGLVCQCNRNFHVKDNRQNPEHNLNSDQRQQPIQSIPNLSGFALSAGGEIKRRDCDEHYKGKPAMDEDNCLWSLKEVDPGVE